MEESCFDYLNTHDNSLPVLRGNVNLEHEGFFNDFIFTFVI